VAKGTHSRGYQSERRCLAAAGIGDWTSTSASAAKAKKAKKGAGSRWKPSRQPRLAGNWGASLDEAIS
jgi:hypothetical protein